MHQDLQLQILKNHYQAFGNLTTKDKYAVRYTLFHCKHKIKAQYCWIGNKPLTSTYYHDEEYSSENNAAKTTLYGKRDIILSILHTANSPHLKVFYYIRTTFICNKYERSCSQLILC